MRNPIRLAMAVAAAVLLIAGCSGTTGSTWTVAPLRPTPSPGPTVVPSEPAGSPAGSPAASAGAARTVRIELTNSLQFQQDGVQVTELEVREGETIHFVLDNTAGFAHDFWIGPPDQLAAGTVSGLQGVEVWESGVREFDYVVTAETAGMEFACTVPGHYQTMRGTFKLVS